MASHNIDLLVDLFGSQQCALARTNGISLQFRPHRIINLQIPQTVSPLQELVQVQVGCDNSTHFSSSRHPQGLLFSAMIGQLVDSLSASCKEINAVSFYSPVNQAKPLDLKVLVDIMDVRRCSFF